MLRLFMRDSPFLGMTLVNLSNLLLTFILRTFHWTFMIHIVLPVVEKVEISKSTDKKSDSFEVKIYKTDEIPQTESTIGLTRFVGNKTKLILKLK